MAKKTIGIAVAVVVVGVLAAGAWYFLRDDTPEDLTVEGGTEEPTGETPDSLDGEWTVVEGGDTRALLAIEEEFTILPNHTATGETPGVTGSLTIEGTEVTAASFTVDLTQLVFNDAPAGIEIGGRRQAMDTQGLEIGEFPEATFELTAPIDIGDDPTDGETVMAEATGDLTLHGVTNEITFTVEARVQGDQIRVAAADAVPIVLADYDIEEPQSPRVVSVAPEGTFDFLIVLQQA